MILDVMYQMNENNYQKFTERYSNDTDCSLFTKKYHEISEFLSAVCFNKGNWLSITVCKLHTLI